MPFWKGEPDYLQRSEKDLGLLEELKEIQQAVGSNSYPIQLFLFNTVGYLFHLIILAQ